ncbi:FitA-like ribbon-helix-helix domain-containing protein [Mesorhizobium sp. PUT5]|uniref:FitA-like ribbon-helix-helix domain-containing protein n=1 Tax=Mesorhizobium sp. PUT5 TaxID=3454629 RepID=UPI003FA4B4A3
MATLTIRNVEDEVRQQLKINAARNGVSLEEELRAIVRRAARQPRKQPQYDNLYDAIRDLVEPYGGFELDIPPRGLPSRDPPFRDWE